MYFGHIELPITDPKRSLAFYCDMLGFEIEAIQGERFIWCKLGATTILLNPNLKGSLTDTNLVLYSKTLEVDVKRLKNAGVVFEKRGSCCHFADPDGNQFQLVDPSNDHSS